MVECVGQVQSLVDILLRQLVSCADGKGVRAKVQQPRHGFIVSVWLIPLFVMLMNGSGGHG